MEELWKPVPEYEGYYEVSNLGRIRNTRTGRTLKGHPDTKGSSLSEAARRTGVGLSNISMNIGGYSKTAGGYTWEHK